MKLSYKQQLAKNKALEADNPFQWKGNIYNFISEISPQQPAEHHREWLNAIFTGENAPNLTEVSGPHTNILAPRGAGKTTYTVLAIAYIVGRNPDIRILFISYTEAVALRTSRAVKALIESPKYQEIFPGIRKGTNWADKEWYVKRKSYDRNPTFLAVGSSGAIASARSDLIWGDDLIKSSKSISTTRARKEMIVWWFELPAKTLSPTGRVIITGTRYRKDDIHGTTFKPPYFKVLKQSAIITNKVEEESYWPEYFSIEKLQAERAEHPSIFESQMQNEPRRDSMVAILDEWIHRSQCSKFDLIGIGIDLSTGTGTDYGTVVSIGRTNGNPDQYQIINASRGKWTITEHCKAITKEITSCLKLSQVINIFIESNAYQGVFRVELVNHLAKVKLDGACKIKSIHRLVNKEEALRNVSGIFETGRISFNQDAPMHLLIDELTNFQETPNDDLADGLITGLSNLYRVQKDVEIVKL